MSTVTLSKVSDTKAEQDQSKKCAYQTTLLPETVGKTPSCDSNKATLLETTVHLSGSTRDRGLGAEPGPGGREVCGTGEKRKRKEGAVKKKKNEKQNQKTFQRILAGVYSQGDRENCP